MGLFPFLLFSSSFFAAVIISEQKESCARLPYLRLFSVLYRCAGGGEVEMLSYGQEEGKESVLCVFVWWDVVCRRWVTVPYRTPCSHALSGAVLAGRKMTLCVIIRYAAPSTRPLHSRIPFQ